MVNKNKLIISLTTIPTRIDKIENVLESLLNQTIKADMIYINIPKKYSRFSECAKVPDFITNKYNDRVKIFYLEEDYGPATKFIGCLLNPDISDKDIILITDDDIEKTNIWTTKLLNCYAHTKVCCFEERKIGKEIIWGYLGFCFRKDLFDLTDMLMFFNQIKTNCYLVDDHWLTGYCHYKKIKIDNIHLDKSTEINKKLIIGNDSLTRLTGSDTRIHTSNKCREDILDNFQTEFPFWCCIGCCKKGKRIVEKFSDNRITTCNNITNTLHFIALFIVLFIVLIILLKRLLPNQKYSGISKISIIILSSFFIFKKINKANMNKNTEHFINIIPKVIIQTYHKKEKIPKKVYDNIKEFAPEYKHIVFDDNECIQFFKKYFNKNIIDTFNNLKGAHKADLFRYCYLYKFGGIYLDIKTELIIPLKDVFADNQTYSVLSINKNTVYQGVIATPPNNPLFLKLINFMIKIVKRKLRVFPYIIFTIDYYNKTKEYCEKEPSVGINTNKKNEFDFYFFKEICTKKICDCKDGLDRYKLCCYIYDGDKKVFKSRYSDFPW
jgi:hypothetical protein